MARRRCASVQADRKHCLAKADPLKVSGSFCLSLRRDQHSLDLNAFLAVFADQKGQATELSSKICASVNEIEIPNELPMNQNPRILALQSI